MAILNIWKTTTTKIQINLLASHQVLADAGIICPINPANNSLFIPAFHRKCNNHVVVKGHSICLATQLMNLVRLLKEICEKA